MLEKMLGMYFEAVKNKNVLSDINFKLINDLDRKLYTKILYLKSTYNKFSPIQGNEEIIRNITYDIKEFVNKFRQDNI